MPSSTSSINNLTFICSSIWYSYKTSKCTVCFIISQENLNELTGKYYDPSQFIDYKAKDGWIASLKHLTTSMSLNSNWTVLQMKLSNRLKTKVIPVHMQPTPVHCIE